MLAKKPLTHLPFLVLVFLISVFSVRGYLSGMTSTLPTTGSDDAIITWILNQTIQKFPNNLSEIFNGNIFYPYKNTLAYSIMMIPSALIAYIPTILTDSYLTAFNFTVVFSQVTTGIILYFLFYEISEDKFSSLIASLVLLLSKIRMSFGVHIHLFVMQYFLLGAYFIIKFRKTEKLIFLYLTFFLLGVQVWESLIQVVFLLIFVLVIFVSNPNLLKKHLKHFIYSLVLSITVSLPPILSYIKVASDFSRSTNIREVAHFSAGIEQVFVNYWSTGLYTLFIISLFIMIFAKIKKNRFLFSFVLIIITGLLFSLGPVLKLNGSTVKFVNIPIPLPYLLVYYLFPPLWAIRSVHRFIWLMAFGMAGVIAIVLPAFNKKFVKIFFLPFLTIAVLGGITNTKYYMFPSSYNYKNVYHFIKDSDINSICEYPFFGVNNNHGEEMKRMVYSLYHKKGLYNGASGFLPEDRAKNISLVKEYFPEKKLLEVLQEDEIDFFVLHKEYVDESVANQFKEKYIDVLIYEDEESLVLDIRKNLN